MPERKAILPEVIRALENCRERIEASPLADILVRVHEGQATVVEITTRHRIKGAAASQDGAAV